MGNDSNSPQDTADNPGGCLGLLSGVALSILLTYLFFPYLQSLEKPGKRIGIFYYVPLALPALTGWPIGLWIWTRAFPGISDKVNARLSGCLFALVFVGGFIAIVAALTGYWDVSFLFDSETVEE